MPHGLAVAGLIVGFRSEVGSIGGASPGARILPVRVLDPFNRGWYSWFTAGILHVARLKATGELPGPVVINFSIQGRGDSAVMTSAIDYAISQGVLFVTFAGTLEPDSSAPGYPGRLTQSITAEATGWAQEGFSFADWLFGPGMTVGQDLSLDPVRRFVFGTSFAAPRTSGIVARLLQSNPGLTQEEASVILHAAAPMTAGQHGSWKGFRFVAPWATPAVEHGLVHDNVYRIPKRYDCTSLNYDFMDAVRQARRCDASLPVVQCNLVVDDSLDCPCLTFVNPANVAAISLMEIVRSVWYSWHCDWGIICGAQACPQIYGSTCVPTVGASGQCIVY